LRREGRRIGLTNGCFDLLHPGHIKVVTQARAACDRLVVGLNRDASVVCFKGEGRPIQDERAGADVLAALQVVDLVVLFDEVTPLELITKVRPTVLVKGGDGSAPAKWSIEASWKRRAVRSCSLICCRVRARHTSSIDHASCYIICHQE
jgi:rfaE bifunctional protein nucleotidyltransferase chain/domain